MLFGGGTPPFPPPPAASPSAAKTPVRLHRNRINSRNLRIILFTSPPPVSKTGLDWGARELRSCPGRITAGCPKSGPARKFSPGLVTKKKSRDAIQGTKVLCPDNADEVEKILRGVRRTCGLPEDSRPLA